MKSSKLTRNILALLGIVGGIGFLLNINGFTNKIFLVLAILGFFSFAIMDYVEIKERRKEKGERRKDKG
jgi:hypothetical protein